MAAGAVGKLSEEQPADFFFRFIEDRYGHGDVASLVAHGCIQALEQHVVSALRPDAEHVDPAQVVSAAAQLHPGAE